MDIQHLDASQTDTIIEGFRDLMYSEKLCEGWDQMTIDEMAEKMLNVMRVGIETPINFPKAEAPFWPGTQIRVPFLTRP